MSKVLVTGATGYIGSHVVDALTAMDAEVIALSRRAAHHNPAVHSIIGDFVDLDRTRLRELGQPEIVVHLAWSDGFNHNAASHIDNLPAHVTFVRRMLDAGTLHFAGLGSMHEVGYWEGEIDEHTPNRPRSMYGIAKNAFREAARLCTEGAGGIFQWLRAYYILGDDARSQSLFSKILRWDAEGRTSFPFSSGTNRYDFIDVEDLARQIAAACLQTEVQGVIECCSGEAVPLRERVEQFISANGLKIRPEYGAFPDRPYDSPAVWGSVRKIRQIMCSEMDHASKTP